MYDKQIVLDFEKFQCYQLFYIFSNNYKIPKVIFIEIQLTNW